MTSSLNECLCGYRGSLAGIRHKEGFLSLSCPECRRTVEAFTVEGLADNWNKPAPEQQGEQP